MIIYWKLPMFILCIISNSLDFNNFFHFYYSYYTLEFHAANYILFTIYKSLNYIPEEFFVCLFQDQ